jgi:DNA-binding CsgD family transcriptional regulator
MTTRAPALVLAGAVGLAGLGIGVVIGPAGAVAATSSATQAVSHRVDKIKDALAGLVKDGTITQAQADKVATTLDQKLSERGFRQGLRFGAGLDEVADILGITPAELRTQLRSGKTLAEIAKTKNISQATLVDKLVAAAKSSLAAEVKAGWLTQARADAIAKNLSSRITEMVTRTGPMGMRGHHRGGGPDGGMTPPAPGSPSSSGAGWSTSST